MSLFRRGRMCAGRLSGQVSLTSLIALSLIWIQPYVTRPLFVTTENSTFSSILVHQRQQVMSLGQNVELLCQDTKAQPMSRSHRLLFIQKAGQHAVTEILPGLIGQTLGQWSQ